MYQLVKYMLKRRVSQATKLKIKDTNDRLHWEQDNMLARVNLSDQ